MKRTLVFLVCVLSIALGNAYGAEPLTDQELSQVVAMQSDDGGRGDLADPNGLCCDVAAGAKCQRAAPGPVAGGWSQCITRPHPATGAPVGCWTLGQACYLGVDQGPLNNDVCAEGDPDVFNNCVLRVGSYCMKYASGTCDTYFVLFVGLRCKCEINGTVNAGQRDYCDAASVPGNTQCP